MAQSLICWRLSAASRANISLNSLINQPIKRHISYSRPYRHLRRSETPPQTLSTSASPSSAAPPPLQQAEGISIGSIFFTSLCAITFGLGVWQTQRYFEKVEMVKKREEDLKLDALSYEEWLAGASNTTKGDKNGKERSYRLVSLRGRFQHSNQVLIGPRGPPPGALAESGPNSGRGGGGGMSSSMQGYWILTPFVIDDRIGSNPDKSDGDDSAGTARSGWFGLFKGKPKSSTVSNSNDSNDKQNQSIVWINRGWIPRHYISNDSKVLHHWDQPGGILDIMTMESETEKPGRFSPPSRLEQANDQNEVKKLLWLDRQAIAEVTNCPSGSEPSLFVQIKDASDCGNVFPARSSREYVGEFKVTPEVHVGYATTWFGLSGVGIFMTRKLLSRGR